MNKYIALLICLFVFVGCAHIPVASPEMESAVKAIETDRESAIIYLFRPYVYGTGSCSWYISINGKPWGTLANQSYLVVKVEPGKHLLEGNIIRNTLCPFQEAEGLEVSLKPGSKTYIFANAGWTAFRFKKVDEQTAKKPLNSFSLSGLNKLFYTLKPGNQLASLKTQEVAFDSVGSSGNQKNPSDISIVRPDSDIKYLNTNLLNPDDVAVIIGNQNYEYKDIPKVIYARNDAESMKTYLTQALGYREENIIFQLDSSKPDLEMIFGIKDNHKGMLYDYIKPNLSEVFIFYSGHGAPDINTNKAYFVTKNCNPDKIAFTGYSLDTFYENISKLPAKKITIVIDACFSGGTDNGKWIVSDASPALVKISNPLLAKDNVVVLTSSKSHQISSWYPEKKHGLFTYFFLRAVNGEADRDNNRKITFKEIFDFVSDNTEGVPYMAKRLHGGRVQNPTLQAFNESAAFISY